MRSLEIQHFVDTALGRYIGISHFSMARIFAKNLQKAGMDMTVEQCRVLFVLFMEDGATQHKLGQILWQEKSSLSRLINTLVSKGYVKKIQSQNDERQKHIHLTEKGWALQEECLLRAQETQDPIEKKFSPEEWRQLLFLLKKLADITREELS